jgi:hypothetical protein
MKVCRCRWLLSEYDCEDLRAAFGPPLAKIRNVHLLNPAMNLGVKGKAGKRVECLWSNYPVNPIRIDLGDNRPMPSPTVCKQVARFGKISYKQLVELFPTAKHDLLTEQFARLCFSPEYYFDGKFVMKAGRT